MPVTDPQTRQARSRAARIAEGGRAVHVVLTPDEARALDMIKQSLSLGGRDAIGAALLRTASRLPKKR
jgi:hypothetical protein